jgi:glycosyltransferase involved in cell wall biosynthesis
MTQHPQIDYTKAVEQPEPTPENRPRIVILVTLDVIGGVGRYIEMLLPGLVADFDVTVAAYGDGPIAAASRDAGARFIRLRHVRRPINIFRDALGTVELVRLFRAQRPDVVHANSSKAGLLGRVAALAAGVDVRIFSAHGWAFATHRGRTSTLYLWADRLMRPLTTATICVSDSERRRGVAAATCDPDRTFVIPNGIDVAAAPRALLRNAIPTVLSVGRLAPPKDFATLIRALGRTTAPFQAAIVGDGPDRRVLEDVVTDARLDGRIELMGERRDVPDLLAGADVFVLSSTSEAMPMSVLEGMAAGLPILGAAVGGIPELVEDGVNGRLFPPGDVEALAALLNELLASADLRRQMGEASRERAARLFDVPRFRSAHTALYRQLLERKTA